MKKTLVALAALAATSAFAQSSVTIDGYFDRGIVFKNSTKSTDNSHTVGSAAGTTTVGIKGVEDLGNGLKMGFSVNTDWNAAGGFTQDTDPNTGNTKGAFANSQSYIELVSANYGKVQFGNINNELLNVATNIAAPAFSTAVGTAYSNSYFSTFDGYGSGNSGKANQYISNARSGINTGSAAIRQDNTVKYVSPTIMGLTFAYGQAFQNDQGSAGTGQTVGVTDTALTYANGPLTVAYAAVTAKVGPNAPLNGSLDANTTDKKSMIGASYQVLPALKLHAGVGKTTNDAASTKGADSSFNQMGVTYNYGKFDILGQVAKVNDKTTGNYDRKLTSLGANYNFSKTARAYFRYSSVNLDTEHAASSGSEIKVYALGISKAF